MLSKLTPLLIPTIDTTNGTVIRAPQRNISLASTSIGRKELFQRLGLPVGLIASDYPEDLPKTMHPIDYVLQTAEGKADSVFLNYLQRHAAVEQQESPFPDMIIAADTMVTLNPDQYSDSHDVGSENTEYRIIGKPEDHEDAIQTLLALGGKVHYITTGVTILIPLITSFDVGEKEESTTTTAATGVSTPTTRRLEEWMQTQLQQYDRSTVLGSQDYKRQNGDAQRILEPVVSVRLITKSHLDTFRSSQAGSVISEHPIPCVDDSGRFTTGHGNRAAWYKIQFTATSSVTFDEVDWETIAQYVATNEPMGKAGSYAIQGIGGSLIKGITGCYQNIVGFPTNKFGHIIQLLLFKSVNIGPSCGDNDWSGELQVHWAPRA